MTKRKFDQISLSLVRISAKRIFDNLDTCGDAVTTGFLWKHEERCYLITNWHNVTGLNPNTGKYLGKFTPTHFVLELKYLIKIGASGLVNIHARTYEIPICDETGQHLWIEHPLGKAVDVVALPLNLEIPEGAELQFLNDADLETRWFPNIGDDCFVVGYPEGISGPAITPIWKRGSVASLPELDYDEKPVFLLDTIGNSGLSGSPVIGRSSGIFDPEGSLSDRSVMGEWQNFVGVYAGRIPDKGIGSQLGRVWKASTVCEILTQ